MSDQPVNTEAAREAALFARYLVRREPAPELIDRYLAATEQFFPGEPTAADAAMLDFVARNPRALPFVDAAAGLLRPGSLLRKKILLMAAILEASVHHAREFLASPPGRGRTFLSLARYALAAGVKLAIGAVILAIIPAERSERT